MLDDDVGVLIVFPWTVRFVGCSGIEPESHVHEEFPVQYQPGQQLAFEPVDFHFLDPMQDRL